MSLVVDSLPAASAIYQFASTAPGTYQVMDVGRFVRRFEALDRTGKAIGVEQRNRRGQLITTAGVGGDVDAGLAQRLHALPDRRAREPELAGERGAAGRAGRQAF